MSLSLSLDQRKAFIRHYLEMAWNTRELQETCDAFLDKDASQQTIHASFADASSSLQDPVCVYLGAERLPVSLAQMRRAIHKTFPDARLTIIDLLVEEEKAAVRWVMQGTDLGGYKDYLPTGKSVCMTGISILRFEHQALMEEWIEADVAGMLRQLGFVSTPQPPRITMRRSGNLLHP